MIDATYMTQIYGAEFAVLAAEYRKALAECKRAKRFAKETANELRRSNIQEPLPFSPGNMAALAAIFGTWFDVTAGGALGAGNNVVDPQGRKGTYGFWDSTHSTTGGGGF